MVLVIVMLRVVAASRLVRVMMDSATPLRSAQNDRKLTLFYTDGIPVRSSSV